MRYKARRDVNEQGIIKFLRRIGASVYQIDQRGFPDLVVGYKGINLLFEVKGKSGKLTLYQIEFFNNWFGNSFVVKSIKDVKEILRKIMVARVYNCDQCGVFILRERISQDPKKVCPTCAKEINQIYTPPTIAFLGTGWGGKSDEPRPSES